MAARISAYHRPERFIDKQEHGPFKRWHHAHYFTPDGGDGTVMRDVVDFAAPLGPLGALAEGLVLRRYMINLIERRNQYIKIFLETS
jgi:ligand-binding SRPBCC domain-containing protein